MHAKPPDPNESACLRPAEGSAVGEPVDLHSENGVLRVELAFQSDIGPDNIPRYCYTYKDRNQSPTLRLHPGDLLILALENVASSIGSGKKNPPRVEMSADPANKKVPEDPCAGSGMASFATNLHFHGMAVPPTCHQDETIKTLVPPGSHRFEYRIQIPESQPPGLYWYHPHPHGDSERQVLGGASGALIIEGIEKVNRTVSGLPERALIVRDQAMPHAAFPSLTDPNRPTKDLSLNYVPILYPQFLPAVIRTQPGQKEFWRVLNASADTFLDLAVQFDGKAQILGLIALDGVPIGFDEGNAQEHVVPTTRVVIPPAGRAEFILTTPLPGVEAKLITHAVERGPLFDPDKRPSPRSSVRGSGQADQDDNDPARPLATILVSSDRPDAPSILPRSPVQLEHSAATSLASIRPVRTRKFFFSEELVDPQNPRGPTRFYITEEGHPLKAFDPADAPNVTVETGDVEDWIIENRSSEPHTFHIHQTHFLVIGRTGGSYEELTLRDTVSIPYWNGFTRLYPSVRLRMDFRDPNIVGTFPYHCHILQHEDGGMMGLVEVRPRREKR
jgi:FtsP/CotA-like multicopper oxidase with cupredoxin domain